MTITSKSIPNSAVPNIAVIGAGLIGRQHIDYINNSSGCGLAAIVDPTPSAKELACNRGVDYFRTLEELIAQKNIDGVILATPNHLHVEQAIACLEAGICTLIEKPVSHTIAEGLKLLTAEKEVQKESDVKLLVGHHRAHSPIMLQAQQLIQEGTLGDVVAISGSAMFYKPDDYFEAAPWRTQVGGGPILINMIHEIHNFRMLCGEIVAVQAFSSNQTRKFDVEDTVAVNFRFENGALGTFVLSDTTASAKSWEQTSLENPSYAAYPKENCYHVAGTFGSLDIPTMQLKTYTNKADRSWWKSFDEGTVNLERQDPLIGQLEHFCKVIVGEAEPLVSVMDGLQNLKVTEAIVEAAKQGGMVEISPALKD